MVTRLWPVVLAITIACTPSKPRQARAVDAPENQEMLAKLKGYVVCIDDYSPRLFDVADDYARRFGERAPTTSDRVIVTTPPDPKLCFEGIEQARALPPALPALDAAGAAFMRTYEAVYTLTGQARDPAKGAALHAQLLAAFREFDRAQGTLFDEVRRLDMIVRRDQIRRNEERDGRTIAILLDHLMLRGEELIVVAVTPVEQLEQLDLAAAEARIAAFEDALAEAIARSIADPKEVQAEMERFDVLVQHGRLLVGSIRLMMKRARDKLAFTEAERLLLATGQEREVTGSPAAIVAAYNKFVEVYYAR